jgi:hypothetical protein
MATFNFTTKQEGYGRQGLYFIFDNTLHYIQSVFPDVEEHLGITHENDCFYDEETETYTDCDGNETTPYSDLDLFLTEMFKEEIGRILFENLDLDEYDFDFENATYEEIAEWALYF